MAETCIVTVAHGRHSHLEHQLRLLTHTDPDSAQVVVAIEDRGIAQVVQDHRGQRDVDVISLDSHPLGLPLAWARNMGVRHALARGADLIVLLDVDCVLGEGTMATYAEAAALSGPALLCGPVSYLREGTPPPPLPEDLRGLRGPHPARPDLARGTLLTSGDHNLFWSLNAALTRETWSQVGGFCEDYVGYGGEDTDFGWTARAHGVDLVWVGGADAYHQHHPVSSPPVEHLEAIVRNAQLFHGRWGHWPMLGWLEAFAERGLVFFDGHTLHAATT
ncbi:MAG: galactosyltransferase-related protein [Ornithinimicrobium sp.]